MHLPSLHEQLAALCCLPGAFGHPAPAPVQRYRNGHHWMDHWGTSYRCPICGLRSRDPNSVLLTCEEAIRDQAMLRTQMPRMPRYESSVAIVERMREQRRLYRARQRQRERAG